MTAPILTVAQLIKLLQAEPQDAVVEIEGCDCVGEAVGIESLERGRVQDKPTVLIKRGE
jgi:hypothetical protein